MKKFIVGVCLALLMTCGIAFDCGVAQAQCGKVWVDGHYNKHGKWIEAHWRHQHWVPGHHNRYGKWIPGHCK